VRNLQTEILPAEFWEVVHSVFRLRRATMPEAGGVADDKLLIESTIEELESLVAPTVVWGT